MRTVAAVLACVVLALVMGGCFESVGKADRVENRLLEKAEAWRAANPNMPLTKEKEAELRAEAAKEVEAEIALQRKINQEFAAQKAVEAAGHAATGNFVAAGVAGVVGLLALLGIGLPQKAVAKVTTPSGGGGTT